MKTETAILVDVKTVTSLSIPKFQVISGSERVPVLNAVYIFHNSTTLTGDYVISTNGDQFTPGDIIALWFQSNIVASGHNVLVQSVNLTSLIATGSATDILVILKYGFSGWVLECTTVAINTAITAAFAAYTAPVLSVAAKTGVVTLVKADVGLPYVDNTADNNKPVSIDQNTAIVAAQAAATAVGTAAQGTANSALTNANSALAQLLILMRQDQVAVWSAGTQSIIPPANLYLLNVAAVNGNVVLNITAPSTGTFGADPYSEITIVLGFTGSYTITAGSGCSFDVLTGSASVTQTLTLIWNGTVYFQK